MKLSYDEAVSYIEDHGVSCAPCTSLEGEYVCDLLDGRYDGYDEWHEPYYTKSTLKDIIEDAKQYKKEMQEEERRGRKR